MLVGNILMVDYEKDFFYVESVCWLFIRIVL